MSTWPVFLGIDEILLLHAEQLHLFGGAPGLRDQGLLASAAHAAITQWHYEDSHLTIFDLAATYGSHLIKNHAFFDGNKRIALAATDCFLEINQWRLEADDDELYSAIISLATSQWSPKQFASFLFEHCKSAPRCPK